MLIHSLYRIIMRDALNGLNVGVRIGGRIFNRIRYAGDATQCSETEEDLRLLLQRVLEKSEKTRICLNEKDQSDDNKGY